MRRLVRTVHAWAGLALSLLFFVFAVTGGALVYKETYWRLVYPELRGPAPELGADDHAAALAAVHAHFGEELGSVKLPEPGVAAYHLYLEGGEAFVSALDHRVIDRWTPRDRPMAFLFDLHAHLMAGETGERVGGVIGLFGVLLTLTGLILWWPARRRFSLAHLIPRDLSRRSLLIWHRDLGLVGTPILLVVLLSGSGLVFYDGARSILYGLFADRRPAVEAAGALGAGGAAPRINAPPVADGPMVARVQQTFPDARIVFYYPPDEAGTHGFRLRRPCELHPNGRSYVYLDAAGAVARRTDACALHSAERAAHALYPLHAGKADSALYKVLVLFSAVVLAVVSVSGGVTYIRKLRGAPRTAEEM